MGDHVRRDARGVVVGGVPKREGPVSSSDRKQHRVVVGGAASAPTAYNRRPNAGSSSASKEVSGNTFDPASPSPGQGKRPQEATEDAAPRPVAKKLKLDQEVKFHVLLPNGISLNFAANASSIRSVEDLVRVVQAQEQAREVERERSPRRTIEWGPNCWVEDKLGNRFNTESLRRALSSARSSLLLILQDGEANTTHADKNLWDVTPKPEMLGQLPQGYTLQTALADQVDNALQAVWSNAKDCRRLVSVTLGPDKITIFDTGHGMDGSSEHSLANWGTVGGSTHRADHHKALGGEPPFLKPYLGKYGAGGVAAALHLGSAVTVWSKTKASKKVVSLLLEQKVLVEKSKDDPDQRVWKTAGAYRNTTEEESQMAPDGSFTRVEISKLKSIYCIADEKQYWKVEQIKQLLRDIYFPYIQVDKKKRNVSIQVNKKKRNVHTQADKKKRKSRSLPVTMSEIGSSSRTVCPVEFEVNGQNLVEVEQCETAISNMYTCNGSAFAFDLFMTKPMDERDRDETRATRQKVQVAEEAKARVTCRYYPSKNGKEALETVLEAVKALNSRNSSTFETMPRVSIRWLGRLLPEVKWPTLPLMEISPRREQKSGVRRAWGKRVTAFVDTNAGFYPNQSKTELERDQPFAVALKGTGSGDFSGTSASGVVVKFSRNGSTLSSSELNEAYLEWVKEMHKFDEDFIFVDDPFYIFNQPNALKELGVANKSVILLHKHMKDSKAEFKVERANPLRIKLQKGTHGLKSELYATVEWFFHDGAEDEHGEVKFLCRPLDVNDSEGCKLIPNGTNTHVLLNKSLWFPAALLSTPKCQRLDAATWRKKIEELSNKSPNAVEIVKEDDIKKLEMAQVQAFPPDNSKFEAGYVLPTELLVVVRPKKGTGPAHKQGMVVSEHMLAFLTVTRCNCSSPCWKRRALASVGKSSSPLANEDHGQVVCKLNAQSVLSKSGVKGLYVFSMVSSEINHLTGHGMYTFHVSVESEKYKDIEPAVSCIQIVPSRVTSKWTICSHADDCTISQHNQGEPRVTTIKLNERVPEELFLQKYDQYDNRQMFERPLDLEVMVVTAKGVNLGMRCKVQAHFVRATQGGRYRLQIKNVIFKSGSLALAEPTYEGVLRACFPNNQSADMNCKVLPGAAASVTVKDSNHSIPEGSTCFQEALHPGDIIKRLTLQGLDAFGNKIEKGQKVLVQLEGVEFQDHSARAREVDDFGCLQLGGLLKVTCHYNSSGSISILSSAAAKLCTIGFQTVTRKLVATQVPQKSFVGRQLEGITIKILDELGAVDSTVDGYPHSITADWMQGVTCPFVRGECVLQARKLPEKPGVWEGKVYFSADRSLSVTLSVQLELATACSIGPARVKPDILTARCGVPFIIPFAVYDDMHQPALLTEAMKQSMGAKVEAKGAGDDLPIFTRCQAKCVDVKMSKSADSPGYEAVVLLTGCVGPCVIRLMDDCFKLKGQVVTSCKLEHGHIAQLVPAQSDGRHKQSLSKPLNVLEAKRCSPMSRLTVTLLDSEDNICSSCEGRLLRMKISSCPEWIMKTAIVVRGVGHFESSPLVIPVGSYQVCVELDSSPDESYAVEDRVELNVDFVLKVSHGNYPSTLKLLNSATYSVSLTEAVIQYLPPMTVYVESADGMRLQSRPTVGVRLLGDNSLQSGPKEYFGTFVESYEAEFEHCQAAREDDFLPREGGVGPLGPVRYEFAQVCVPSVAGTYVMEFFVRGTDLLSSQHLIVRHGPPSRLEIIQREPGQEMDVLQVSLLDGQGNICEDVYDLEVGLELAVSKRFAFTPGREQCVVYSKSDAVVKRGKGDFGVFELSQGMPGMYTLKVFALDGRISLTAADVQIFVAQGNISDTIQNECTKTQEMAKSYKDCLAHIAFGEHKIEEYRAENYSIHENIRRHEVDLRYLGDQENVLRSEQVANQDDRIIHADLAQPVRNEQYVMDDICNFGKGRSAAEMLLRAQCDGNFLSPLSSNPAAKDILGLVVMLGRVESENLNKMLAEFLGVHSLLLIISRTQTGINALEEYDQHGNVNDQRGLHGVAQRFQCTVGRFDALALTDIRSYDRPYDGRPPVDINHPQKLLNIEPPKLPNNEIPVGFLGYAVNLVHLRQDHAQIRVTTRQGEVGLRESLFFHLFGHLQVYDTRQHMNSAKDGLRSLGGAISLDGGMIKKNQRQVLGRRSERIPVHFGSVPLEERMSSSLLPPVCYALQRRLKFNLIGEEMKAKHDSLAVNKQRLAANVADLEQLEKVVEKTRTEKEPITEATKAMTKQMSELARMANAFPKNMSRFEAGYSLPRNFVVVVRPRKGSAATKQGMIVPEPMAIQLEVRHCDCSNVQLCTKRRAPVSPEEASHSHTDDDHSCVVCSLKATSTTKNGVKGLYVFNTEASDIPRVDKRGTYSFRFELESEKYKDVVPAVSSIEIFPATTATASWTFCNNSTRCKISDHEKTEDAGKTLAIRLEEPVKTNLFLQKYDEFGNSQAFETPMAGPMELEILGVTLQERV